MNVKAYMVSDDEHSVICFAKHNVVARREGANELGTEFGSVRCERAAYADDFAEQGWVPPQVLLANGWWMGCRYCGNQVWEDGEDEDGNPAEPVFEGQGVYCDQGCKDAEEHDRAERARLKQEVIDGTLARWPEAEIIFANSHDKDRCVQFRFEGGKYPITWRLGEETMLITPGDLHAFRAWDYRQQVLTEQESGHG